VEIAVSRVEGVVRENAEPCVSAESSGFKKKVVTVRGIRGLHAKSLDFGF
jgi:hypothetical protein